MPTKTSKRTHGKAREPLSLDDRLRIIGEVAKNGEIDLSQRLYLISFWQQHWNDRRPDGTPIYPATKEALEMVAVLKDRGVAKE